MPLFKRNNPLRLNLKSKLDPIANSLDKIESVEDVQNTAKKLKGLIDGIIKKYRNVWKMWRNVRSSVLT